MYFGSLLYNKTQTGVSSCSCIWLSMTWHNKLVHVVIWSKEFRESINKNHKLNLVPSACHNTCPCHASFAINMQGNTTLGFSFYFAWGFKHCPDNIHTPRNNYFLQTSALGPAFECLDYFYYSTLKTKVWNVYSKPGKWFNDILTKPTAHTIRASAAMKLS